MRVAWFSPVPPVQSGIAAYTAEILPRLTRHHVIDLIVDDHTWQHWAHTRSSPLDPTDFDATHPIGPDIRAYRAHDFVFLHDRAPYDAIVYQLGNATCHDYMWPYLLRYPGLVVCHDGHVHLARARRLLSLGRRDDYRAEFTWAHPHAPADAAEFAVGGMTGASYYFYPWLRPVTARARALAAHTPALASTLAELAPSRPVRVIRMGVTDPGRSIRPDTTVTIAAFGLITEEKRIEPLLRAFAAVRDRCGAARIRLVGARAAHFDIDRLVDAIGLGDVVDITGYVSDDELTRQLAEADVCLCLRWPTTGETSASWLRCLAAGRPTVITDLTHTANVPALDPRSWTTIDGGRVAADETGRLERRDAICVAIDILDEDHSLRLALPRLCTDAALRVALGEAARRWWSTHHTLDVMEADYLAVLDVAAGSPLPPVPNDFPAHLLADGTAKARELLHELGVTVDLW